MDGWHALDAQTKKTQSERDGSTNGQKRRRTNGLADVH